VQDLHSRHERVAEAALTAAPPEWKMEGIPLLAEHGGASGMFDGSIYRLVDVT